MIPTRDKTFFIASRPALRSTQPPIQWVQGDLFLGVKQQWREADHFHLVRRLRTVELYFHSTTRVQYDIFFKKSDNGALLLKHAAVYSEI
jgi:hypothetical protein